MLENVSFWKLTAAGNDFFCLDNSDGRFDDLLADPARSGQFARTLCRRHTGIGADGLIFHQRLDTTDEADISARIFEADGSEVELCGNGTACYVHWAFVMGHIPRDEVRILTLAGVMRGSPVDDGYTRVCISLPEQLRTDLQVPVGDQTLTCDFVVTGIPHVVTYVDDIAAADVAGLGPALRHHDLFQPRGANANFVQVLGEGEIALRTWEFGVEGETLACGTGSAAAAMLTARRFDWKPDFTPCDQSVRVHTRGGETLRVFFTVNGRGEIDDLCLESPVHLLYRGDISKGLLAEALSADSGG
ncbi:hypothetical protein LCGC14_0094950 [marine sediment metagenome]|uniref:Diaminopimelate epimerase n=1 Tax=marine sediment metagenome TaxID=412755 RepID=A0A0F9YGN9_9ZZZZ|nr:diaminopimelate epimerase [Phycisphaerae bacterium]